MKKFFENKKAFVITLALLIGIVGVGSTMALLSATSNSVINTFASGAVNTHIEEEVDDQPVQANTEILKQPVIVNDGPSNAFIRARITISPSTAGVTLLTGTWDKLDGSDKKFTKKSEVYDGTEFKTNGDWIYSDGYFYYAKPVSANPTDNQNVTSSLFDAVVLAESADVTIYQESVFSGQYEPGERVSEKDDECVKIIKAFFDDVNDKKN